MYKRQDNQELKVFLDLASISAGESDMEIGKLSCFQTAVNGYAPLIFEARKYSASLNDLMETVDAVFAAARKDKKIQESLKDANNLINWIKDIGERHGSVESSSLTTVQQICATGHFIITAKDETGKRWTDHKESISLWYENNDEERKVMKYGEMDELRSKLMLITISEGVDTVEKYTRFLSQIEVVSKTLATLLNSGCHLFSQFKLKCWMESEKVKLRVDFGHKSGIIQVSDQNIE